MNNRGLETVETDHLKHINELTDRRNSLNEQGKAISDSSKPSESTDNLHDDERKLEVRDEEGLPGSKEKQINLLFYLSLMI